MMKKLLALIAVFLSMAIPARAQHFVEARGADTKYGYLDWNYTFQNQGVIDIFYVRVPGDNEFNFGREHTLKTKRLSVTPVLYFAIQKEGEQKGLKVGLIGNYVKKAWTVNCFVADAFGAFPQYQVLDTFIDITRALPKHLELGISGGFFHQTGSWNPQIGPVLKRNDRKGSWAVSYRFGSQKELRFGRILTR